MADSKEINTSNLPMINVPFAFFDDEKITSLSFIEKGVDKGFTVPVENGGKRFTREHLNAIGYFSTLGAFLDRIGYPYGRDRDNGESIGGYPKGAILISEDDDYVREYVSLEENNLNPLPKEAEDGTYVGDEHWAPTIPPVVDFFPDYAALGIPTAVGRGYAWTHQAKGTGSATFTPEEDGWYNFMAVYPEIYFNKNNGFGTALYESLCAIFIEGRVVARLDGRTAFYLPVEEYSYAEQGASLTSTTLPLRKGVPVKLEYKMWTYAPAGAAINVKRWGNTTL